MHLSKYSSLPLIEFFSFPLHIIEKKKHFLGAMKEFLSWISTVGASTSLRGIQSESDHNTHTGAVFCQTNLTSL